MDNIIVELPRIKDLEEFDRLHKSNLNVDEVPDADKRYVMFIKKKKDLNLPLTYQEQKITNIIA